MRHRNDIGTQYRSAIYTYSPEQAAKAEASKQAYEGALARAGMDRITTEIAPAPEFYCAEDFQRTFTCNTLAKNPSGYRGIGGTGVSCPVGAGVKAG